MDEELKKIFSDNFNYWIESEGRRQDWVAHKIGVNYAVVSRWKTGKNFPRVDHFEKLAEIMGVHPAVLLVKDGVKDPVTTLKKILSDAKRKL